MHYNASEKLYPPNIFGQLRHTLSVNLIAFKLICCNVFCRAVMLINVYLKCNARIKASAKYIYVSKSIHFNVLCLLL